MKKYKFKMTSILLILVFSLTLFCVGCEKKFDVDEILPDNPQIERIDTENHYKFELVAGKGGRKLPEKEGEEIDGLYKQGDVILLYLSTAAPEYSQVGWKSSNGGVFFEAKSGVYFVMPSNDVVVTGVFKK